MTDEIYLEDPCARELPRFTRIDRFHKGGAQRVFYKGGSPKQKETPQTAALAQVARAKWSHYQNQGKPAENKFMRDVDGMDSEAAMSQVTGAAQSATSAEYGKAAERVSQGLSSAGINPNSGKFKSTLSEVRQDQGASGTDTASRTATQQKDEYVRGLQNVAAIGSGQSTTTQYGLSDVANSASAKAASDARSNWNESRAGQQALGTVAGAGLSAFTAGKGKAPFTEEEFQTANNLQMNRMVT